MLLTGLEGGADSIGRDSDDLERSGIDPNDDRAECEICQQSWQRAGGG
jgi:hypothetical protein